MSDNRFDNLLEKLKSEPTWPQVYMFKFITPADNHIIAQVQELFDSNQAQISMRESRKGNYVSITVKELMLRPERVIEIYKTAAAIKGVIVL
jgi:putative lipoic acid-binding regulatory protein